MENTDDDLPEKPKPLFFAYSYETISFIFPNFPFMEDLGGL